jgi:hypothetical protein
MSENVAPKRAMRRDRKQYWHDRSALNCSSRRRWLSSDGISLACEGWLASDECVRGYTASRSRMTDDHVVRTVSRKSKCPNLGTILRLKELEVP